MDLDENVTLPIGTEMLIHRAVLDKAMAVESVIGDDESYGWFLLVVAGDSEGYREHSVAVLARVIGNGRVSLSNSRRVDYVSIPIYSNWISLKQFKGCIKEVAQDYSNIRIVVDAGGNGLQLCKDLEEEGLDVVRVNWINPCFYQKNQRLFFNLRTQAMVDWCDSICDSLSAYPKNWDKQVEAIFIYEATHLPCEFTQETKIRYQMMPKEKMRAIGIKSSDIVDAMSFAYLEGVHYNVSDEAYKGVTANANEG